MMTRSRRESGGKPAPMDAEDESTMYVDDAGPSGLRDEESGHAVDSDFEPDEESMPPGKRGKIDVPPMAESTIRAAKKKVIIPAASMAVREAKVSNKTGSDLVKIVMHTKDASVVTAGLVPLVHNEKTGKIYVYDIDEHIKERKAKGATKVITVYEIFGRCTKLTITVCKGLGVFKDVPDTTMKRLRPIMWNLVRMHQDNDKFLNLWRNPLMDDGEPVTESGWYQIFKKYKADITKIQKHMDDESMDRATNKLSNIKM